MSEDRCDLLCLDLERAERVRAQLLGNERARELAGAAAALADATRLRVAAALCDGEELCVCDLAWIVARSDKLVSHHLRALRAAGLADARREGKVVYYRLTATGNSLLAAVLAGGAATVR